MQLGANLGHVCIGRGLHAGGLRGHSSCLRGFSSQPIPLCDAASQSSLAHYQSRKPSASTLLGKGSECKSGFTWVFLAWVTVLLRVSCCFCNSIVGRWVARFPHLKLIYSFVWQNCCFQSISADTEIKPCRGPGAQGSSSSIFGRNSALRRGIWWLALPPCRGGFLFCKMQPAFLSSRFNREG